MPIGGLSADFGPGSDVGGGWGRHQTLTPDARPGSCSAARVEGHIVARVDVGQRRTRLRVRRQCRARDVGALRCSEGLVVLRATDSDSVMIGAGHDGQGRHSLGCGVSACLCIQSCVEAWRH